MSGEGGKQKESKGEGLGGAWAPVIISSLGQLQSLCGIFHPDAKPLLPTPEQEKSHGKQEARGGRGGGRVGPSILT